MLSALAALTQMRTEIHPILAFDSKLRILERKAGVS